MSDASPSVWATQASVRATHGSSCYPVPSTIYDALSWATAQLREGGVAAPRREAIDMWSTLAAMHPVEALAGANAPVPREQWSSFSFAVHRRAGGEPLAYTLGQAGFRTLQLFVDRRVLIPRPETEGLVQLALDWRQQEPSARSVADVGTGCGCIALSLAVEGSFDRVVATDLCESALAVAGRNVAMIRPEIGVALRQGDLVTPLGSDTFDIIVSNPPYVSSAEFAALDSSVRDFEPRAALISEEDGMQHIRRLLESAGRHLNEGGLIALEVDARRATTAVRIAERAGWESPRIERDVFGRKRYLAATKPAQAGGGPRA